MSIIWPVILVSCILIGIASWGIVWLKENNPNKEIEDLKQQVSNLNGELGDLRHKNENLRYQLSPFSKTTISEYDPRYGEYFGPQ